jgi:hypothetical protein
MNQIDPSERGRQMARQDEPYLVSHNAARYRTQSALGNA